MPRGEKRGPWKQEFLGGRAECLSHEAVENRIDCGVGVSEEQREPEGHLHVWVHRPVHEVRDQRQDVIGQPAQRKQHGQQQQDPSHATTFPHNAPALRDNIPQIISQIL